MNYDEYNWGFNSQQMDSTISRQPKHKKPMSNDRTCNSGSSPAPSASSSSISAASTATAGPDATSAPPSVQSKVSESFMLSKMPRKYFSDIQVQGTNPFTMEDNYGKI
jgi:hypothetical protein